MSEVGQSSWVTVVLPPSQAPRFRDCCYFCGRLSAAGHIAVRVSRLGTRAERAVLGSAPRRVRIPACLPCRMRRLAAWIGGLTFLVAVFLFGGGKGLVSRPVPWLAVQPSLQGAIVVGGGALWLLGLILTPKSIQMSFDARGLVYEFAYGRIADWFAFDNDSEVRPVPPPPPPPPWPQDYETSS